MIFHSLDFLVFFVVTVAVYWALPHRWQNRWLLVTSYFFYGYIHPWFLGLIAFSTLVDWWAARRMESAPTHRRWYLGLSIGTNMGMLGFFKYFNFFAANLSPILASLGLASTIPSITVLLPVGISFFTFQALSYTIDVYRGRLRARQSLVDVATFVALFPQLVAGPIERASALLPQVEARRTFSLDAARTGLLLMAWGYFKKLVVADSAGVIANKVFSVEAPGFALLWAGVFAFGLQIYADFSAYSDIARGTARWLGFDLMVNFDQPYFALGPRDFWRRWHISLSTWFRDYVYIPLGGSRRGLPRELGHLLLTFLLSGLWHGASWNFVMWGGYHGLLLVLSRLAGRWLPSPPPSAVPLLVPFRIVGMVLLAHVGWLMFRETDTAMLLRHLTLSPWADSALDRQAALTLILMLLPWAAPVFVEGVWMEWHRSSPGVPPGHPSPHPDWPQLVLQGCFLGAILISILLFRSTASLDFIYFQF
ncbi:MAG: MBOAT family protein [Acidobacteria bacterium]|nr:MBOAT family protein [Acidobacteriota bacterium]